MRRRSDLFFTGLKVMVCLLMATTRVAAQQTDSVYTSPDTLSAMVRAYETNRPVTKIPAAISIINEAQLQRFTNTSLVSVMNMQPGVRMEERSPGSYRINMRGSSLRSPFGIRNVKVYLNDIPFTDPGGNTYLNQLDFRNIQSLEIIKGPASSLYGAGSGGAMLLHTLSSKPPVLNAEITGGSYGLFAASAAYGFGSDEHINKIQFTHQQSEGWRDHTAMRRDIFSYENRIAISERQTLQAIVLYGDLYYQTPGALTLSQFKKDPGSARPAAGTFPSAGDIRATIYQQSFLAGITNTYHITKNWKNTTAVYGAASWFKNPTFRLYEKRTEPHYGARSFFTNDVHIRQSLLHLVYGVEFQKGIFTSNTFKNRLGNPDTILTNDEINNWRYSVFAQAEWLFGNGWNITGGISYNKSYVSIQRLLVYPVVTQKRTFNSDIAPRLAIMKSFGPINIYATASKGFSPPTTAELLPGTGVINNTLKAEEGINYEAGIKGEIKRFSFDADLYHFNVTDAISQRRDASGGDYYVNAGETKQNGAEIFAAYKLWQSNKAFIAGWNLSAAYTGNFYTYKNYQAIDQDYSGKQLPGIPKHTLVIASDIHFKHGGYINLTYQSVSKIAMNDGNTEYTDPYHLLSARVGWRMMMHHYSMEIFAAGDNLFNEIYSLGNDINAAAGRYYNAAARRNYAAGLRVSWL